LGKLPVTVVGNRVSPMVMVLLVVPIR